MDPLASFGPATRRWFADTFAAPTAVQARGWPVLAALGHALLLAPTGSGKTLAAFLACLDRLVALPADAPPGVRVVYISPLKALVADIERNLRAPLIGLGNAASRLGLPSRAVRVDVRTGDTAARDRRIQARDPAEILVTTPESLYLVLGSGARETLRTVETVIVDEIHAVAGSKRGVHLALTLERLSALADRDPQRIGLSATQRPLSEIARFLGGDRKVEIVDAGAAPRIDLEIVVPVADMEHPVTTDGGSGGEGQRQEVGAKKRKSGPLLAAERPPPAVQQGMWPVIYPRILELVRAHRSTIVFVNSRLSCERIAQRLNELAGEEIARAHHGSIAHHQRAEIEDQLKSGQIPVIVASSSLELGIDMGFVDLVVMVESPGSVARGLQRVGRAGHQVGGTSIGRLFPKYRGDLLEAVVVADRMRRAEIESTSIPRNCLDVLSQQVVAAVAVDDWDATALLSLVRRTAPYRDLGRSAFDAVLDMLSGRYPSDDFRDLSPRIIWDRTTDQLRARRGARTLAVLNAGTIPDRGLFTVQLGAEGPRLGELDEEMVFESRRGDRIILGASTWRVEEIKRDRVIVSPAPGEPGRLPFWHGDRPGRPRELGEGIGAFSRVFSELPEPEARERLAAMRVEGHAAGNLLAYLREQRAATGVVPSDRTIVVESFRDELGDWRVCILTPFGMRVHAPWAMAIEAAMGAGGEAQILWTDDGIAIRFADAEALPGLEALLPDPDEVEDRVVDQARNSAMFASRFRENAGRALLLPRRRPGGRSPLWAQRLKAQNLLAIASQYPSFPLVIETYRELLRDVFDLPGLIAILRGIRSREIQVAEVETKTASPFARSLVFAWVAAYMYDQDTPLAERRAAALSLDRALLRELLGEEELASLLDPAAIAQVEAELGWYAEDRRATHADTVHDLLRRLGELSADELSARCAGDWRGWIAQLERDRRVVPVRLSGAEVWIAVEDAGRYGEALGVVLPPGIPAVFLESVAGPLESLVQRWARTHGPFSAGPLADRWGLPLGAVGAVLDALAARGLVQRGRFRPESQGEQWCDPTVLQRLRQRSIAALRHEIAPVEPEAFGRFLLAWHGIGQTRGGVARLQEVVAQLEGVPLPYGALESQILPSRIADFQPRLLDELGALGGVVWIGRGALGPKDGKVAVFRRESVGLLLERPTWPAEWVGTPEEELRKQILEHLTARGASFAVELQIAAGNPPLSALTSALWDLVWAGLVTNDTFAPLRALGARRVSGKDRFGIGGRWSAVAQLMAEVQPTARAHARALALLERHGVATPSGAEDLPGGFTGIYPVFRAMEDSGRVRRGLFVEGLGGAQFALPGVVDRLRAHRIPSETALLLSASDPANPWGALFPWPEIAPEAPRPRRVAGAELAIVGGAPVWFADRTGRSAIAFPAAEDRGVLDRALEAWLNGKRRVRLQKVDGAAAADSRFAAALVDAGFAVGYDGMEWPANG